MTHMKNFFLAFSVVVCALSSNAQTGAVANAAPAVAAPLSMDGERARIAAERRQLEQRFALEDAACHDRFAVNSCRDGVSKRRREAVADLRRQELLLNDQERRARSADQLRKIEEKASPAKQQEAANKRAKAVKDYQERLAQQQSKDGERTASASGENANAAAGANKIRISQEKKAQAKTAREAEAADEARQYNERQKQAAQRRAEREQDRLKRAGLPPARPLPVPK